MRQCESNACKGTLHMHIKIVKSVKHVRKLQSNCKINFGLMRTGQHMHWPTMRKQTTNKTINKLHELKQSSKYDSNYSTAYSFHLGILLLKLLNLLSACSLDAEHQTSERINDSVVHFIICYCYYILMHSYLFIFVSSMIFLIPDLFKSVPFNYNNLQIVPLLLALERQRERVEECINSVDLANNIS